MDKRTDYAVQDDIHPDYQAPEPGSPVDTVTPVPVSVGHSVEVYSQSAQLGNYYTFIIPPGSANATMVLPEDPGRVRAILQVNNSNVVLCNSQSAAQAAGNIAGTTNTLPNTPAGFIVAKNTSPAPLESQSAVWAVNTDPTTVAYVSVCVERNNP